MKQPMDMSELENAGYEYTRQLERLAHDRALNGDIYGVHHIVGLSQSIQRSMRQIAMRYKGN
jgi:hypothetical protein